MPKLVANRSRISARREMDRGHEDVRRAVAGELDDHLGQIGLPGLDAGALQGAALRPISSVVSDFILIASVAPRPGQAGSTIAQASGASRAQCTCAAGGRHASRASRRWTSRLPATSSLIRRGVASQLLPLGHLRDRPATLVTNRVGRVAEVVAELRVLERARRRIRKVVFRRVHVSLSLVRIRARCRTLMPVFRRLSPPPMCIRQELSTAVQTSAPVA